MLPYLYIVGDNMLIWWIIGSIFIFCSIALLVYFRSEYEKETLRIVRYKIKTKKSIKKNYRFIFLSDMHEHEFGYHNQKLLEAIDMQKPDGILIGGDLLTTRDNVKLDASIRICQKLSSKYKIYYANGNHEERLRDQVEKYGNAYLEYIDFLKKHNIIYLSNEGYLLDECIRISGLDIQKKYYKKGICPKMPTQYIIDRLGRVKEQSKDKTSYFEILMAHSPLYFKTYADWGADISLSGHFHGGTIRLPFGIGLMTPQFQFFNTKVVGHHKKGEHHHIISAGLGTHSINIRLNNYPELIVIDIEKI